MAFEWLRGGALRVMGWVFIVLGLYMLPRGFLEGVVLIILGIVLLWYGRRLQQFVRDLKRR